MRTLVFEQITDSRFNNDIEALLDKRVKELENIFANIIGVTMYHTNKRKIIFDDNIYQYRTTFYIQKDTNKITWNDIYKLVNSIKPVPYKFIDMERLKGE